MAKDEPLNQRIRQILSRRERVSDQKHSGTDGIAPMV